ncbi:MAG: hypothetical protein AAF680_00265 [Pseudomonadota bacterium]
MDSLLQTARNKLLAVKLGLADPESLVAWADDQIRRMDDPPLYLFNLSTGTDIDDVDSLAFPEGKINASHCRDMIRIVVEKSSDGSIDTDLLGSVSYQLALKSESRVSELLYWISDEIHLCEVRVKHLPSSMRQIEDAVREILEGAA